MDGGYEDVYIVLFPASDPNSTLPQISIVKDILSVLIPSAPLFDRYRGNMQAHVKVFPSHMEPVGGAD